MAQVLGRQLTFEILGGTGPKKRKKITSTGACSSYLGEIWRPVCSGRGVVGQKGDRGSALDSAAWGRGEKRGCEDARTRADDEEVDGVGLE